MGLIVSQLKVGPKTVAITIALSTVGRPLCINWIQISADNFATRRPTSRKIHIWKAEEWVWSSLSLDDCPMVKTAVKARPSPEARM